MMKSIIISFLLLINYNAHAQVNYNDYFTESRLRLDFGITGNYNSSAYYIYHFYNDPLWGGPHKNLIDTIRMGEQLIELYDSVSNVLLYSHGFSTLFKEWQTIDEAQLHDRIFIESAVLPYPKNTVRLVLYERSVDLNFISKLEVYFNPEQTKVIRDSPSTNCEYRQLESNGLPEDKVDIVFLSEGYTSGQKEKFWSDIEKFKEAFFEWEPYSKYKIDFNIHGVFVASQESGTDNPDEYIWKNTVFGTSFCTFDNERYLATDQMVKLREIAAAVPYDQICVLVNSEKYGGGGIYNNFTIFSVDHAQSNFLFLHEFGHAFASLGDEYFTSEVSFNNFISSSVEPYQPNLTTLVNFSKKWETLVVDSIPIPTPDSAIYYRSVGVFEGGGYAAKGIYRPFFNCSMKSVIDNAFCPVCKAAIVRQIEYYTNR